MTVEYRRPLGGMTTLFAERVAVLNAAVARRAGALCATAEPHRHDLDDWPCQACRRTASLQLGTDLSAPASMAFGGPATTRAIDGGSVPRAVSPPFGLGQGGTPTDHDRKAAQ